MIRVIVGDKSLRTHSLDRVARRLYGVNAVALIVTEKDGTTEGVFAVPDRHRPKVYLPKEQFIAAA